MARQPPPDPPIAPIGRHSIAVCDCGRPAVWIVYLTIGKSSRRHPFRLCDACLALELNPATHSDQEQTP